MEPANDQQIQDPVASMPQENNDGVVQQEQQALAPEVVQVEVIKEDGIAEDTKLENAAKDSSKLPEGKTSSSGGKHFTEKGKLFIGALSRDTATEKLTNYFKKYGELTDSVIMKDRNTGYPRGFGFVTFADPTVCDTVLRETHAIDGKTVDVKRCVPLENMAALKGPKTKKIFVGGIPISITEDEFKNHFAKFGKVVEHQIMTYHSTGRSRGFGFITFESEQSVEDVISQGTMHEFAGKQVEIKKAEPKKTTEESVPPFGRGGRFDIGYGVYRDSYGLAGAGAYGNDSYRHGGGYIDGRGSIYGIDSYGDGSLIERNLSGGTAYGRGYDGSGVGLGPYGVRSLTGGYDSLLPYENLSGPYGSYIDMKGPYDGYGIGYSSGAGYGLGGFSSGYDGSRHSSSSISNGRYHPYRR